MTPLIRQDDPAAQKHATGCRRDTVRRYALALTPAGSGKEAAVTATAVPPLSGGAGEHGSEATHAFTIANSVGAGLTHVVVASCRRPGSSKAAQPTAGGCTPGGAARARPR